MDIKEIAIDYGLLLLEMSYELILIASIFGKKRKELVRPVFFLMISPALEKGVDIFYPNLLGWVLMYLISTATYRIVTQKDFFSCFLALLFTNFVGTLLPMVVIAAFSKATDGVTDRAVQIVGSAGLLLIAIILSRFSLHRLYERFVKSAILARIIMCIAPVGLFIFSGLTKIDMETSSQVMVYVGAITFILLLVDVLVIKQEKEINRQRQSIEHYETYEPMAKELIMDIRARQHDFNNQIQAIRMLPYTCNDYESLKRAIDGYSVKLQEEYAETSLLRLNMPVVAGFLFSKQKAVEQEGKKLRIEILSPSMIVTNIPEYELVKLIGILLDNAAEAIRESEEVVLILKNWEHKLQIITRNPAEFITPEKRKAMFERGYSTKQSEGIAPSRGFGLANLQELVKKYEGKVFLENEDIDGRNHLKIEVII